MASNKQQLLSLTQCWKTDTISNFFTTTVEIYRYV